MAETVFVPLDAMPHGEISIAPTFITLTNLKVMGWYFVNNTTEGILSLQGQIPKNVAATPNAKLRVTVLTTTSETSSNTRWEINHNCESASTGIDVAGTTETAVTLAMPTTLSQFAILDITLGTETFAADKMWFGKLTRTSNNAGDTHESDVVVISVGLLIDVE